MPCARKWFAGLNFFFFLGGGGERFSISCNAFTVLYGKLSITQKQVFNFSIKLIYSELRRRKKAFIMIKRTKGN